MKTNLFKYIFIIIIVILILIAVYTAICTGKNKNLEKVEEHQRKSTIIKEINLGIAEYDTLNPIKSNNKYVQEIATLIYEPLFSVESNYKISNCLADECSKIGNTTYLIKLKPNIKWHDGTNLTTNDIEYTYNRIKEEKQSIYKENINMIKEMKKIDETTLKIEVKEEVPFFEYKMTFPIIKDKQAKDGTGKYKIKEETKNIIKLERNEEYWDKDKKCVISNVNIKLYHNIGELYNSFKLGGIDLLNTSNYNYTEYIGKIGFNTKEYIGKEYDYIILNHKNKALEDQEVRKAITNGINRKEIIDTVYQGAAYETRLPISTQNWMYTQKTIEPESATTILKESGWTYQNNVWQKQGIKLKFNLLVNENHSERVKVAEMIKNQLGTIGIIINIKKANNKNYEYYLKNQQYDMVLTGINVGLAPDIEHYFKEENLANYKNETINSLLKEIREIKDEILLKGKYNEIFNIYIEENPYISLYFKKNTLLYASSIRGEMTPNWYNIFYHMENWYKVM